MAGIALEASGLTIAYGSRTVVSGVDLILRPGTVTALLGGNGAGKTSLLKVCAGLLPVVTGRILVDGVSLGDLSVRRRARQMAYLPQAHRAAFPYPVAEVVLMGRWPHSSPLYGYRRQDHGAAERAMDLVGIAHLAGRPYTQLSGGERQLVLIARALAQDGRILMLDEPETGLDFGHRQRLMLLLSRLAGLGQAVLLSSHFPDNVLWFADQVVMVADGGVIAAGSPAEVMTVDRLRRLYGVEVRIERTSEGRSVCLPAGSSLTEAMTDQKTTAETRLWEPPDPRCPVHAIAQRPSGGPSGV
ncbi:MAG TPA: ABC transporter ATP-binding protein [Telmatospirillum sp.]|nr:ABC transporter ATP-binding protein [Telmatospirillum sp.]